jgi:cullin-associated NEDD8-dissociated protein 1
MARDRGNMAQSISAILNKLNDPDPDIRFMQLSDLSNILTSPSSEHLKSDPGQTGRIIDGLLKALTDQHGEVQNQALKWSVDITARLPSHN